MNFAARIDRLEQKNCKEDDMPKYYCVANREHANQRKGYIEDHETLVITGITRSPNGRGGRY